MNELDEIKAKLARAEAELADFYALGHEAGRQARSIGILRSLTATMQCEVYQWVADRIKEIVARHQEAK